MELVNYLHQFAIFLLGHSVYQIWGFKWVHVSYEVILKIARCEVKCYGLFWLGKMSIQVLCLAKKNSLYIILVTPHLIYIYFWYLHVVPCSLHTISWHTSMCPHVISLSLSLTHTHTHTHTLHDSVTNSYSKQVTS